MPWERKGGNQHCSLSLNTHALQISSPRSAQVLFPPGVPFLLLPPLHLPRLWRVRKSWVQEPPPGTSLVAQWLRIRLPMQGIWVQALVREDPTCHGATKPVCHNY